MEWKVVVTLHALYYIACDGKYCENEKPKGLVIPDDYNPAKEPLATSAFPGDKLLISSDNVAFEVSEVDDMKRQVRMPLITFRRWIDPRLGLEDGVEVMELKQSFFRECIWSPNPMYLFLEDIETHEAFKTANTFMVYKRVIDVVLEGYNVTGPEVLEEGLMVEMTSWVQLTINCMMDFSWYPFDKHNCYVLESFMSNHHNDTVLFGIPRYRKELQRQLQYHVDMRPLSKDFDGLQLYNAKLAVTGWRINLKRKIFVHLQETFFPTGLFVAVSWVSFLIPPDSIPGRMALLITLLLMLVNIFLRIKTNSPHADAIHALGLWVIMCMCLVACAIVQYGLILFLKRRELRKVAPGKEQKTSKLIRKIDDWAILLFPTITVLLCACYWMTVHEM